MKYPPKHIGLKHIDWVALVLSTELPCYCKFIVTYLSRYMNKDQDVAWPSQGRMIAEMSMSKTTLNRSLNILESEGWITRQRGDSKSTTRYYITFPKSIENAMKSISQGSTTEGLRSTTEGLQVVPQGNTNSILNSKSNKGVKRFTPPTLKDVQKYISEKNYHIDAESFINHYESVNWYRGKTKIKDWKACVRTWVTNGKKNEPIRQGYGETI